MLSGKKSVQTYQTHLDEHYKLLQEEGYHPELESTTAMVAEFERWLREDRDFLIPAYPDEKKKAMLTQEMINSTHKEQPVVIDIGCAEFSMYYYLLDYVPKYTYLGIDINASPEVKDWAHYLLDYSSDHNAFKFFEGDVSNDYTVEAMVGLAKGKVDFIFLEDFAVSGGNNPETNNLLKHIIEKFIPSVLSDSGSFHFKSVSFYQDQVISQLLMKNNIDFIYVGGSFICGKAALNDKIIHAVEETNSPSIFYIDKSPYSKQSAQVQISNRTVKVEAKTESKEPKQVSQANPSLPSLSASSQTMFHHGPSPSSESQKKQMDISKTIREIKELVPAELANSLVKSANNAEAYKANIEELLSNNNITLETAIRLNQLVQTEDNKFIRPENLKAAIDKYHVRQHPLSDSSESESIANYELLYNMAKKQGWGLIDTTHLTLCWKAGGANDFPVRIHLEDSANYKPPEQPLTPKR